MKNIIIFLCLCTICMCRLHAADSSRADSLLLKLDQAIKERPIYMEQKELKLVELKRLLHRQIPDEERFAILGTLLDEYRSFNTDSALHMAEEREQIAIRLGNREYIDNARMNKADVLGMTGMYKEVMDLMRNIHIDRLPVDIHPYYYHIYRTVYGLMADYAVTAYEKKLYTELTDKYRDSLLLVNKDNLLIHTLIQSDQYNVRNEYDKAIRLLTDYLALQKDYEHDVAICAYTLSESYRLKGDKEKEKEYLHIISDESRRLSRLVRRMLEVSQLQSRDVMRSKAPFDVCESMRRVLISMEKKITDRGLDVEADIPDEPVTVLGDNDLITQVIYNLLENATKFARAGSTLYLGLAVTNGRAVVSVRNEGDTIPAEEIPLLFERFHKSDKSRSEDKDGYGLGLYIVKTILEQHKEKISVTSEDGVTAFSFSLATE